MTKEEAKKRQAKLKSKIENYLDDIKHLNDEMSELEAIINKKDDWKDKLVDPKRDKHFYISGDITSRYGVDWLKPMSGCNRNAALLFKEESHAKIMANKMQLMQEMYAFAHARNEGWVPDWKDDETKKWGLTMISFKGIYLYSYCNVNLFIFGIAVKSEEIAEEMLKEFGKRIEEIYNKQY